MTASQVGGPEIQPAQPFEGATAPTVASPRLAVILWAVLLTGAALRIAYAASALGMYHPDEIHQSLEPAHGIVYGFGFRSWEFLSGARPWTTPGIYVGVLAALKAAGIDDAATYLLVVRLLNAGIACSWAWLCYRIARALASPRAGLFAAALTSSWYFFVLLAPRGLNHTFSVTFALWALARLLEGHAPTSARSLATGALFGLAAAFRYQDGIVLAGALVFLAFERRGREIAALIAGASVPLLAVGLLDLATWGLPFHSLFAYLQANIVQHASARDGTMAVWFYPLRLPLAMGAGALWLLLLPMAGKRAWRLVLTVSVTMLVMHSLTDNKQLRFVLPAILVLFCALACGADALLQRLQSRSTRAATAAAVCLAASWLGGSIARAESVTFADLGVFTGQAETVESPWQFRLDLNRALIKLGRRSDLCGLVIYPYGGSGGPARFVTTGGYTFLNRPVPITMGPLTDEARPFTNYALMCPDSGGRLAMLSGFEPLGRVGECLVLRSATGSCDATAATQAMAPSLHW